MRIVFLIQDCTTVGGTERVTCCLASEMARQGHDVTLLSVFGVEGKCSFEMDERVKFDILADKQYNLAMSKFARLNRLFHVIGRVKRHDDLLNADVVIAQKFFAALLAISAGFKRKTVIGDHYPYKLYREPWLTLRNMVYRKARVVVVLTESYKQDYINHGVNRVEIVENMIPIVPQNHIDSNDKVILAVGRLAKEKGFDTLIKSVAGIREKIDGWRVEICGEGEEREKLEQLIADNHLDDVIILRGLVGDVTSEYQKATFGVMSSRYEGFPMTLLEAAACGLPMVSFDCPEGPGVVLGNGGGVLVRNQDADALGEAIVMMIEDAELRRRCSEESKNIVEKYSPENIYNQWMQIIKKYL